jgi:tRNA-splicing ligase RtcB
MEYKKQLKKIDDSIYELPKTGNMLVPGRLFLSERLLELVEEDALKQVANVAMLPGIQKYSIGLSDMHTGYGFCIGGVAGFDLDSGIISPGGVGYDIDCLSGDSKILTEFGYWKKIKDFEDIKKEFLNILNKEKLKLENSKISLFMAKNSDKIIKIKTKSGTEILATEEHPIYTKNGMKKIKEINKGEEILTYPFEGVEYQEPKKILLVSEQDIDNLNRSYTSKLQIKNKLKELDLLPLYLDNPKIPLIIKLMGFIFGDGSLSINKNLQVGFYGKKEDLELIKEDLKKVGFCAHLYSRKRKHMIKTQYNKYEFERIEDSLHCSSSALTILLHLLGTPKGNKAEQDYKIPEWIMNSIRWHKRLFLASLFGAELSSPRTATNQKFNFYGLIYSLNKKNPLYGLNFINQISAILEEFEIKSVLIKYRQDELNGTKSTRIRLMLYSDSKNLINFFSKINYEYNIKKRRLSNAAILWLKQKEKILEFREETMKKAREMKQNGFTKSQIITSLEDKYSNKYFIDKAIYHQDYGRTGSRIAYCFISFNEFVEKYCYGENGFIWDEIENKEEIDYNDLVYDFTISNENHNFIANGLVVSNCSVRLLKTNLKIEDIKNKKEVLHSLFRAVPSGVGRGSNLNISYKELDEVLKKGAKWAVENGYGFKEDLEHLEENGCLSPCNPDDVSKRAKQRGIGQLGTLGAGNHFLEIQKVDSVFDSETAKKLGLEKGQITIMIHCGSRGLGHQVASDYIKLMEDKYGWPEFDRELVNAPIKSELGKKYFSAMNCAANFAFANKQIITHWVRENMKHYFPDIKIDTVYEVCHNIAKIEKHIIDGKEKEILVMRKGATRSFPNQPVLIPGSMGTASYVLIGTEKAMDLTFGSTAHGAGRVASRTSARKSIRGEDVKNQLNKSGIDVEAGSWKGLSEEAPQMYKDIDEVVRVSHEAGIGNLVVKLVPVAVMKG